MATTKSSYEQLLTLAIDLYMDHRILCSNLAFFPNSNEEPDLLENIRTLIASLKSHELLSHRDMKKLAQLEKSFDQLQEIDYSGLMLAHGYPLTLLNIHCTGQFMDKSVPALHLAAEHLIQRRPQAAETLFRESKKILDFLKAEGLTLALRKTEDGGQAEAVRKFYFYEALDLFEAGIEDFWIFTTLQSAS